MDGVSYKIVQLSICVSRRRTKNQICNMMACTAMLIAPDCKSSEITATSLFRVAAKGTPGSTL